MNAFSGGFMSTLGTRLSLALIGIVIALGVAVFFSSQAGMRSYYEELNQKLNSSVAMYVTGEFDLIKQEGEAANVEMLEALARTAMIINPAVEVYVLNVEGDIIGHNFPEASILRSRVPVEPLLAFMGDEPRFPLRNIDPRHSDTQKVFSASEIRTNGLLLGYLYVVLGGELYDNIEDDLNNSYSRTMLLVSISAIVVAALIAGVIIFRVLVGRLSLLSQRMQSFSDNELAIFGLTERASAVQRSNDEIDMLGATFDGLTAKVSDQFEMLREADEVKRELISNVSHDLRTPLTSIQGYLETLLIKNSSLTEEERLKYLQTAMKSSTRLGLLIGDLFELSKLETNQTKISVEAFSLTELIFDIVQEFKIEVESKKIEVEVCNEQFGKLVYADISLIQRVFENLIRNAIAYTPEHGKIVLSIQTLSSEQSEDVMVSVSDTGKGIRSEDLPYIFDRFYSNPDQSRKDVISTGLGLAIVKRILELHGTKIDVQSKPAEGTRFEFCLPTKVA